MRFRYFTPSFLTLFFAAGAVAALLHPLWRWCYLILLLAYVAAAGVWGMLSLNVRMALFVSLGIIASHWTYGFYFLKGLMAGKMEEARR
ncbi:MAG: hypothetical protein HY594_03605 [Candidatus Omnitrophica bacterium]|nr:hypothetical protein [Candidatus Omnitrophota bacterium]